MNANPATPGGDPVSRRTFLKSSAIVAGAAPFIARSGFAQVSPGETLRGTVVARAANAISSPAAARAVVGCMR